MKHTNIFLLSLFLVTPLTSCNGQNQTVKENVELKTTNTPKQKATVESKYKIGQMWSYKTRSNEKDSFFIVVKIDADQKLGNIIHIAVQNLKIKNPDSPDGLSKEVTHMPFAEKSIDDSTIKLLKEKVDLPNFEDGYKEWKQAFDDHKAGIYTITIAKAVETMEETINKGKPIN